MISHEQARAARALLDWKQNELADRAGVSITAINYFERQQGATRNDTVNRLQGAFEEAGIEFLPGGGLRRREEAFQFLNHQGADFIARLNADMYRALHQGRMEVSTCSGDEHAWNKYAEKDNRNYLAFAAANEIRERILMAEGARYFNNVASYRVLPRTILGNVTYTLYADRIAYILWPQKRIVILRNPDLAATLQSQFNLLWEQGAPIKD